MPTLRSLVGQLTARRTIALAQAAQRLHHAYLFEGPVGVGKATTARALAQVRNCLAPTAATLDGVAFADACGRCEACRKIDAGLHPDVFALDMTPKGLTERVRDLCASLGYRPHEGRTRVVLLDPADDLAGAQGRAEPANALLKTLEEPPPETTFVLVTAETRRLPPTVRSRCQVVRFGPLSTFEIASELERNHGVAADRAATLAGLADGSLGAALRLVDEAATLETESAQLAALWQAAERADAIAIFEAAQALTGEREQAIAAIEHAVRTAHQRIVALATSETAGESLAHALGVWRALGEAREALHGNVAPPLVIEHTALLVAPTERQP